MANGLAMAANRANVLGFEILLSQQGLNALCCKRHPVLLGNRRAGDLVRAAGAQAKQLGT